VGPGKVLGCKSAEKREFAGKNRSADNLGEFLCIGPRWRPAAGHAEQF
jgi:hypothetical protein